MARILFVGNGFNLVSDGGASWNSLGTYVGGPLGPEPQAGENQSFGEYFPCTDTKGDGESGADGWLACSCDNERSNKDNLQEDIVLYDDADFPDSPFAYVFGAGSTITAADLITLKAEIKARANA